MNMNMFGLSSTTSSAPVAVSGATVEKNPEDIPKEELMQLCMKMNKRMQAMETKGKELVKKKSSLLNDRHKLLELINTVTNLPLSLDDQDLDMNVIESSWLKWSSAHKASTDEYEQKLLLSEQALASKLSALELKHRKEISEIQQRTSRVSSGPADGTENLLDTEPPKSVGNVNGDQQYQLESLHSEKANLQATVLELQSKCIRTDSELERLKATESQLRQQLAGVETLTGEKNRRLEEMARDADAQRVNFEEKLLHLQMASNTQKSRDEGKDKDLQVARRHAEKLAAQLTALTQLNEEKDMSVRSNKEMISALQARLIELEPELAQAKERAKEVERHSGASAMMRVEQDALLTTLRKDLRLTLEERDQATRRVKELEEFRVKAEGQLLHMATLTDQVTALQTSVEDKTSFITRLRSEAQTSERNHAMRTAMLATCEAQLESLQQELSAKDATNLEVVGRITELQAAVVASEARLAERVQEANAQVEALEKQSSETEQAHLLVIKNMRAHHEETLEALKRDHARKSSMARTLLSEREEDVRLLTAKVAEQHDEITSGAPSERKIFELAQSQAKREATHGMHSDTREVAFQQLQTALASKDLELAHNQQSLSRLTAEVLELRRTHQRDGINMDYLKNIVIQYMTLPVQSSEKLSLVRVLATLLQFTPNELAAVMKSDRDPIWGSKPAKEVKRYVGPPVVSGSSRPPSHNGSAHNGVNQNSRSGNAHHTVPPVSVIVGAEGSLESRSYTPPTNSSLMTATIDVVDNEGPAHRPLSRHLEMSQSDYDFREKMQILETMDVLNISTSDPDLSLATGNSSSNYTPRRYPSTPGGGLANVGTVSQEV